MLRSSSPSIQAGIFRNLTRVLADKRISAEDLCAVLNVQPRFWEGVDRIELSVASELLECAAEHAADPALALKLASEVPVGASGLLGQLQAVAPTVRDLIRATAHYADLAVSGLDVQWCEDIDGGTFSGSFPVGGAGQTRQLSDLVTALLVERIRIGAGPAWHPQLVALVGSRPPGDDRVYTSVFGPNVVFGARRFSVVVEASVLDRKLPNPAIGLFSTVLSAAREKLAEVAGPAGCSESAARAIERLMATDEPVTLERVGDEMGMSARSLQWRLEREATSFEGLLHSVRKAAAIRDLADDSLSMAEISGRLGFSEPSAFTRWANRALGMSPTVYRRRLRNRL